VRTLLLLALTAALTGCGFSTGLQLQSKYKTVGVELFANDSPERDVEREFHAQLSRSMRNLLAAPLVAPGQADLFVRGRIQDYFRSGGVRGPDNNLLEQRLAIRAIAELRARDGRLVAGPISRVTQVGYTRIDDPENEFRARSRILKNLADQIVLDLVMQVREEPQHVSGG